MCYYPYFTDKKKKKTTLQWNKVACQEATLGDKFSEQLDSENPALSIMTQGRSRHFPLLA